MNSGHEQFDQDRNYARGNHSRFPTGMNRFNLHCSNCNESFYVDRDFYQQTMRALEEGLDNPFACEDCQDDFDELGHVPGH